MGKLTAILAIIGCAAATVELIIAPYILWIWNVMPAVALALGSK